MVPMDDTTPVCGNASYYSVRCDSMQLFTIQARPINVTQKVKKNNKTGPLDKLKVKAFQIIRLLLKYECVPISFT